MIERSIFKNRAHGGYFFRRQVDNKYDAFLDGIRFAIHARGRKGDL